MHKMWKGVEVVFAENGRIIRDEPEYILVLLLSTPITGTKCILYIMIESKFSLRV